MRYQPAHKAKIHQKIVEDASERVRAEGLSGAAVTAVMRDTGLTHGGFYKHFKSKDDLLLESLGEAFRGRGFPGIYRELGSHRRTVALWGGMESNREDLSAPGDVRTP